MSDRELLEMAAKASGLEPFDAWGLPFVKGDGLAPRLTWNPLIDDGDALRLAVKLGISISFSHRTGLDASYPAITEVGAFAGWCPTYTESFADDWPAATRRAIVRAAASIGANTGA